MILITTRGEADPNEAALGRLIDLARRALGIEGEADDTNGQKI